MDQEFYQKKIFNEEAEHVNSYYLEDWQIELVNEIKNCLSVCNIQKNKDLILDLGTGALGYVVNELAKENYKAIGLDISNDAILKAKQFAEKMNKGKWYRFITASAEKLPFEDKSISFVSAIALMEHIVDDEEFMDEISRVLKIGGAYFCCFLTHIVIIIF
ncbi:MAG: class I SAM-dependent methyltransferase [Patescibacteria group bacterium]